VRLPEEPLCHHSCFLPQISKIKPDNFESKVISVTDDYVYAEFQGPIFGFIDDVEVSAFGLFHSLLERSPLMVWHGSGSSMRHALTQILESQWLLRCVCVQFYFPSSSDTCEYRSASRVGENDSNINRKRIKAIRLELQKKGWKSVGF
jgi:uncharacterized protein (DUF1499 family)